MKIRTFQSNDRLAVVSLWNLVFPNSTGHNDPDGSIERKVAQDDGLFFIAEDDGSIVGTVLAGYDGHRGWIYSLAVAPDLRRRGIATRLVLHVEKELLTRGCIKLNLQVRAENFEVVAFYESLGFNSEERISMGKLISD